MGDRVKGKVAIVTGAGSVGVGVGNGKAAAILYAREGARVLLVDHNLEAAEETKKLIDEEGGDCMTSQADVSKADDCRRIVEECIAAYGRLDILHNNVGIEIPGGIQDISEEDWDRTLDVNLKSVFLMCKYALPQMEKQGNGAIVNISSINAIRTLPALSGPYGASKAGMIALTREIAVEYAPKGIRANAVLPGMMNTPFVIAALTEAWGGEVGEMTKMRDAMCPTGKQGESWDVASASLFLASDDAKYVTGTTLVVDGALTSGIKTA
ncbi:MAG: SDR family oxidoreductase [Chloroflexi bacterium]|nr:SDR family oxidoreductase [Chloroflexota bacterium]